ncbi:MAG TPA: hypothetical protein VEJ84_20490 [Acidimicrobiales bacterium]|nr:hypothetical protein [Acidimicrobiales bacterium]
MPTLTVFDEVVTVGFLVLLENEKLTASTFIFEPDTEVTLPEAVAKLAGRLKVRPPVPEVRVGNVPPVVRGKPPPPLPPAPPPPKPNPRTQVPFVAENIITVVASMLPPEPLVPVAEIQPPLFTPLRPTGTVAVITVFELTFTVVWPDSGFCTSSMLPVTLAIEPEAAGLKAAGGPLGVVVGSVAFALTYSGAATGVLVAAADAPAPAEVLALAVPQAAATSETTARVPTARATRRA